MDLNSLPVTPPRAHERPHDGLPFPPDATIKTTPIAIPTAPRHPGRTQLEGSRTAVLHDLLPSVHQVPLKFFEKNIFPRIPQNIKPSAVLKRLERQRHIRDGRWSAFPSDPHTYSSRTSTRSANDNDEMEKENENKVFGRLHEVVTAIQECVTAQKRTTTEYMSAPDCTPVCSFDEKAGRPDAYFVLGTAPKRIDGRVEWRNIVTPAEFKLRDTREGLQDDVKKICWNMYQIMLEDPRRRFVLAFTIEDTMMRIWMGNRTEVIVSEPFNFITDHEKVTHFFLSQLYGREADLGIDTTMTIVSEKDGEIPRYDIKVRVPVKSKRTTRGSAVMQVLTYRTTRLINDDGARSFRGSGTRVWEVVPVVNGVERSKDIHVLKDNWVDDDRQHEGDILKEIMDDSSLDKLAREELAALFLTPIAQSDVYIIDGRDGQEKLDSTRGLATRKACIPANATTFSLVIPESYTSSRDSAERRESTISDGEYEDAEQTGDAQSQQSMVLFSDKHHHRIVFKEKCEPLSTETSLHRVFVALFQITSGIAFMHTSGPGWVHRDLSAGNILRLPDTESKRGEAKLSDLEYAKRLDEKSAHVIRTGTSNFMAVEVSQNAYLFNSEREEPKERKEAVLSMADLASMRRQFSDGAFSDSEMSEQPAGPPTISETKQPFFYNPVHDLESIWWIAIYFVVNKETELAPKEPGVGTIKHTPLTEDQRVYARSLFYDWATRFMAIRMVTGSPLDRHLSSLPSHLSMISTELIDLRKKLVNHYMKIEEPGFVMTKTVCQDLYGHFTKAFKKIARSLAKQDILVAPIKRSPNERLLRKNIVARSQESSEPSRAAKRRKVDSRAASSTEQRETVDGNDISKSVGSSSARVTRSKAKSAQRKGKTAVISSRKR